MLTSANPRFSCSTHEAGTRQADEADEADENFPCNAEWQLLTGPIGPGDLKQRITLAYSGTHYDAVRLPFGSWDALQGAEPFTRALHPFTGADIATLPDKIGSRQHAAMVDASIFLSFRFPAWMMSEVWKPNKPEKPRSPLRTLDRFLC